MPSHPHTPCQPPPLPIPARHPHSRISAQVVYNEYIQDRNHVHMNSTIWLTLTDFVKHLGRKGYCKVEETPKGWFITLIQVGGRVGAGGVVGPRA